MSRLSLAILIIVLLAVGVGANFFMPDHPDETLSIFNYQPMATYCRMTIVSVTDGPSPLTAAQAAQAKIQLIESLASTYQTQSEISLLANLEPGSPRPLSTLMYPVFERSLHYARLTEGAFDITVGPLMNLWRTAAKSDALPSPELIAIALQAVGYNNITLDSKDHTITFNQPHMSITLDAIVKGYAADLALAAIRQAGLPAAMVDLGGDIVCYGAPPSKPAWTIGIQNPFKPAAVPMDTSAGSVLATIAITDAAVATSGNYQRTFTIQDRPYSQIIDPRTGQPVTQAPSVTIIAPTAADADALATACSVLPVSKALELIKQNPPHRSSADHRLTRRPPLPQIHRLQ